MHDPEYVLIAREEARIDAEIGDQIAADERVAANERRRLAEARREIAVDEFEVRYRRWLASDLPEQRRSPDWTPEFDEMAEVRAALVISAEAETADDETAEPAPADETTPAVAPASADVETAHPAAEIQRRRIAQRHADVAAVVAEARAAEAAVVEPGHHKRVDVDQLRELASAGKTLTQISAALGHARQVVWRACQRNGIAYATMPLVERGRRGGAASGVTRRAQESTP